MDDRAPAPALLKAVRLLAQQGAHGAAVVDSAALWAADLRGCKRKRGRPWRGWPKLWRFYRLSSGMLVGGGGRNGVA
jgi:hypothetical protein